MATVVLSAVGTTGDVVPYLALAKGLNAAGHQAKVVTHEFHRKLVESKGLELHPDGLASDVEVLNQVIDEAAKVKEPLVQFDTFVQRFLLLSAERRYETHLAINRGADLVVAHGFDYLGQEAAIKNGVPWASVTLVPHLIPTMEAPVYPFPRLGAWWTKKTWITLYEMSQVYNRRITAMLGKKFGAPWRSLGVAGAISERLHLIAASEHLTHRRSDWPSFMQMTGAWLDAPEPHEPEPALASFLAKHERPIVVTFGSMGGTSGAETSALVSEALALVDRPAIVQGGYAQLSAKSDRILSIGFVPHDWLFTRAGCVVHHAGAGTSTAASRAGVPSVAVPHLFDQYYWAGMLHERGLAPKAVFRGELTAKKLASQIESALKPKRKKIAEAVAAKIATEDGVKATIALIEATIKAA
jgi:sterol 3beta-glucosyltransferase